MFYNHDNCSKSFPIKKKKTQIFKYMYNISQNDLHSKAFPLITLSDLYYLS